jgi:hypothetical protein
MAARVSGSDLLQWQIADRRSRSAAPAWARAVEQTDSRRLPAHHPRVFSFRDCLPHSAVAMPELVREQLPPPEGQPGRCALGTYNVAGALAQSGIAHAKSPGHVASSCAGLITCNTRCGSRGWFRAEALPAAIDIKITIRSKCHRSTSGFPFSCARPSPAAPAAARCSQRCAAPRPSSGPSPAAPRPRSRASRCTQAPARLRRGRHSRQLSVSPRQPPAMTVLPPCDLRLRLLPEGRSPLAPISRYRAAPGGLARP